MKAPTLPKHLGYVRRLKNQGITLAALIVQHKEEIASSIAQHKLDDDDQHPPVILTSDVTASTIGNHAL